MAKELIALAAIAAIIGVCVLFVSARERLRRQRLRMKFQLIQRLIDPGSTLWSGPQIRGSFRGRELDGYRRNELIGFTQRSGTNGKTIVEFRCLSPLQFTAFTFPVLPFLAELLQLGAPRKPDNRAVPPSRRQRFRLRVEGRLQLNMPEYLFLKMSPDRIRQLLEGLDSVACKLEQVGNS